MDSREDICYSEDVEKITPKKMHSNRLKMA